MLFLSYSCSKYMMWNILVNFLAVAVALVLFVTASDVNTAKTGNCSRIEVRKEWRSLSRKEKKAWIKAVNVRSSSLNTDSMSTFLTSYVLICATSVSTRPHARVNSGHLLTYQNTVHRNRLVLHTVGSVLMLKAWS